MLRLRSVAGAPALACQLFAVPAPPAAAACSPSTTANTSGTTLNRAVDLLQILCDQAAERATYSASFVNLALAATPTDFATLTGSASKTVKVTQVRVSCHGSSAARVHLALIRRSAANTGGTSAALTAVKHDTASGNATASAVAYTANPSGLGTAVGYLRGEAYIFPTANNPGPSVFLFGGVPGEQPIVLSGTAQILALSGEGSSHTAGVCSGTIVWGEE